MHGPFRRYSPRRLINWAWRTARAFVDARGEPDVERWRRAQQLDTDRWHDDNQHRVAESTGRSGR